MSITVAAISFYWHNDTPTLVTWRCRLATAPDTPSCIVIHGGQFTGGVHPPNQFVPEIVSPLPCSPALVRHTLLIFYFLKAPLTNATPAFTTHVRERFNLGDQLVVSEFYEFKSFYDFLGIMNRTTQVKPPFGIADF